MKILERGTPPSEPSYEVRCKACGSLICFQESEAKKTETQFYGTSIEIACPVCQQTITITL